LRELEQDARREIGIIFPYRKIVASVHEGVRGGLALIARELPPVGPVMEKVMKEVASGDSEIGNRSKRAAKCSQGRRQRLGQGSRTGGDSGSHEWEGAGEKMSLNSKAVALAAGI
jgi:hypothetical protein